MYNDASLALIPSAVGDGVVYNARPVEVLGAELVTNGDFATDSNWSKVNSTISSGAGHLDGTGVTSMLYQSVLTNGKTYKGTFTVSNHNNTGVSTVINNDGTTLYTINSNGILTFTFTHSIASGNIIWKAVSGAIYSIDNVSVKEVLTSAQDFDFSRASEATRVLSGGRIEKVRTNSILQSNQFDTTWVLTNAPTLTSGQSGYDGSSDAWKLEASTTGSSRSIHQVVSSSGVQVFSVYAKAGTTDWIRMNLSGIGNRYFDIGNGAVGGSGSMDGFITDVGGGWYRCTVLGNGSSTAPYIFLASDNGNLTVNAGDNVYIQSAQLEQGTVATEYIETTSTSVSVGSVNDMPRLDWSGGCPSLLLEPQRTNLTVHSEYVPAWANSTADIAATSTLSPDGTANAYRVTGTPAGLQAGSLSSTTATTVLTTSIWVRKVSGSDTATHIDVNNVGTTINITTDWARYELTSTAASGVARLYIAVAAIGDVIEVWGAQTEVGSYATSYIPSYGTATTRVQDSCSKTGISSLIGQTEGTVFFQGEVDQYPENVNVITYNRQTTFSVLITKRTDGTLLGQVFNSAGSIIGLQTSSLVIGTFKVAFAYKSGDTTLYVNGTQIGTSSVAFTPAASVDQVYIGPHAGGAYFAYNHTIECDQTTLFTTRLSDTELEKLTTL